jgi:stage II sporulation protein D
MLTHPPQLKTNEVRLLYSFIRIFLAFTAVTLLLLSGGCASHSPAQPIPVPVPVPGGQSRDTDRGTRADDASITIQLDGGRVARLSLDEYIRGTVAAEMWLPASENREVAERIFEVQALVARTYALANRHRHAADGFDLCSSTHCQLYRAPQTGRWSDAIDEAVARTRGQAILFDDAPILALFHANCGGATSAADAIWGGLARPYLRNVADGDHCALAPGATWRTPLTRDALTRALDADARTAVRGRLDSIDIVEKDAAGRASLVALTGARSPVVRGEELRLVLVRTFGARSIRSPRFTVRRDGDSFVFEGTGIGHGAGLCQFGAMARLRAGASPAEVITFYYPGTTIGRKIRNDS